MENREENIFSDNEAQRKFDEKIDLLKRTYYTFSKIEEMLTVRKVMESENYDFLKFSRGIKIPKIWFTDVSYHPDMVFTQLASDVTLAEEIYISQEIPKLSSLLYEEVEISPQRLSDEIINFVGYSEINLITVFIPINFFYLMHTEWSNVSPIRLDYHTGKFNIGRTELKIVWSNKFNNFKDIILINKEAGLWICKEEVSERLKINYNTEIRNDNIDFFIEHTFIYQQLFQENIKILSPINPPEGPL